jgi:GntR family transcriptional repressor for pyruvate dehydrogenase complex
MEMKQVDATLFKSEKLKSTVEIVIDTFRRLLISKKLMPGDRLPTETELAENLNVSRGSVREAMKILSSYGVVQIERGNCTYISKSSSKSLSNILIFQLLLSEYDKVNLFELRETVEIGMVEFVFSHATPEDFAELWELHKQMKKAVESKSFGSAELAKMDINFHKRIAKTTANPLILQIYDFVMELFVPSIEETIEKGGFGQQAVCLHEEILLGYESGNLARTVDAIRNSTEHWYNLS